MALENPADKLERAERLLQQGLTLQQAGNGQQALILFAQAQQLAPTNVHVLNALGGQLGRAGRIQDAEEVFKLAISLAPEMPELHYNKGLSLQNAGRHEEAIESYSGAIERRPDYPEALTNRGISYQALGRSEEALADHDRAIELQPGYARAHANRAVSLQGLDKLDDALATLDHALALEPRQPDAHVNRGAVLMMMERFDDAIEAFQKAIKLYPRFERAQQAEAYARLLTGDFERGWPKYEYRIGGTYSSVQNNYAQPTWRLESQTVGKTVLIYGSYILGDTIMFARYADLVAARGAKVKLVVPPRLKALFQGLKGGHEIIGDNDPMPAFDMHRSLASMPFLFKTDLNSIRVTGPYFTAPADLSGAWKATLGNDGKLKVGVAWDTDPAIAGREAVIPSTAFEGLAGPKVRLIALQKTSDGALPADIEALPGDFDPDIADYADLAAIITNLDLVITSDTPLAHLAGALGKPVWLAVHRTPDWRWLLERSDSPWYPSMRIFRQKTRGDWSAPFAEIKIALDQKAKG